VIDPVAREPRLLAALASLGGELQLRQVLQCIVTAACSLVDARYGALGVIGPDGSLAEFITEGVDVVETAAIGALPQGQGVLRIVIDDPRPLRLSDLGTHPKSYGFPANHPPMRSFLGVPLTVRERVFGNLYLCDKRGAAEFGEEDEELLVALAATAGSAIANARLYDEVTRRERSLTALQGIATALLAGTEPDDVLRLMASHARDIIGADTAAVAVLDGGPGVLRVDIAVGDGAEDLEGAAYPQGGTVLGEVLNTGRLVAVDDAAAEGRVPNTMAEAMRAGPCLFAPLWLAGRPFGTLAVAGRHGRRPFAGEDLRMVQSFATHASVALEYGRSQQERNLLAVHAERERIAHDLHDSVISSLFAIGLDLQGSLGLARDPVLQRRLEELVGDLDATVRQIRSTIFSMTSGPPPTS
jgi:GAF domain-containing protein